MIELKNKYASTIAGIVKDLFSVDVEIELTIPDAQFGDFATNCAMRIAKEVGSTPRDIAEKIVDNLTSQGYRAHIAGPGFINIHVRDDELYSATQIRDITIYANNSIVVEYSCPNYFKELHAGHLYQTIVGDVIARLLENAGALVHRTNFGADVGLSAARAMWGVIQHIGGENPEKLDEIAPELRTQFIAHRYVEGATADTSSDNDSSVDIMEVNKRIYEMHRSGDTTSAFAQVYYTCREWSRRYFMDLYEALRITPFEKYYPESSTEEKGRQIVQDNLHANRIFSESQGAIVYHGEQDGLHTRVFITKDDLPTYETKDLGLIYLENEEFSFSHRILLTGRDQAEYMKVVWRVYDRIFPGSEQRMTHLTNGIIKFGDGKKMSSRLGNVTRAVDVIEKVRELIEDSGDAERDIRIALGAIKYEFIKYRLGGDIAFDPVQSVSLHGDSGPYLQYALVRAFAILEKSIVAIETKIENFDESERLLVRKLAEYSLVVEKATMEYMPHYIAIYLYELAQQFNRFYEVSRVIGDPREAIRIAIVREYSATLEHGLKLLGIEAPEKM